MLSFREKLGRHHEPAFFLALTMVVILFSLALLGGEPASSTFAEQSDNDSTPQSLEPITEQTAQTSNEPEPPFIYAPPSSDPMLTQTSSDDSEQTAQPLETTASFDMEVIYAYIGKRDSETTHSHFEGIEMQPIDQYPSVIYFNVTHISSAETESCDAKMEVYLIKVTSSTGFTEKYLLFEGTSYNPNYTSLEKITRNFESLSFSLSSSVVRGFYTFNLTANQSLIGHRIGSIGCYESRSSSLGLWSDGEPASITVSVYRIAWIVASNDKIYTIRNNDSEPIEEVQLEPFGDGFIYNTVIPKSQLTQTDLFSPKALG
jgi:hypothetical protein